jgi:hypothetical protein
MTISKQQFNKKNVKSFKKEEEKGVKHLPAAHYDPTPIVWGLVPGVSPIIIVFTIIIIISF